MSEKPIPTNCEICKDHVFDEDDLLIDCDHCGAYICYWCIGYAGTFLKFYSCVRCERKQRKLWKEEEREDDEIERLSYIDID
jgi:hypothetical protein